MLRRARPLDITAARTRSRAGCGGLRSAVSLYSVARKVGREMFAVLSFDTSHGRECKKGREGSVIRASVRQKTQLCSLVSGRVSARCLPAGPYSCSFRFSRGALRGGGRAAPSRFSSTGVT